MHLRLLVLVALLLAVPSVSACPDVPLSALRMDFPGSGCQDPDQPSRLALDACVAVPEQATQPL